jgi:hypothetical protein
LDTAHYAKQKWQRKKPVDADKLSKNGLTWTKLAKLDQTSQLESNRLLWTKSNKTDRAQIDQVRLNGLI